MDSDVHTPQQFVRLLHYYIYYYYIFTIITTTITFTEDKVHVAISADGIRYYYAKLPVAIRCSLLNTIQITMVNTTSNVYK